MSWWRRLFGREPAAPTVPAVRIPAFREVVPGELDVRVYTHDFANGPESIPCWSYVTDGLRRHGQQELVFTLRRRPGEGKFPDDPFRFFAQIQKAAADGKPVAVGGFSGLRPGSGFLGFQSSVGFAYVPAEKIAGVNYPEQPLAAVLLVGDEVETAAAIGTYRALARLGRDTRYFPTPAWSDRDRKPVVAGPETAASTLGKAASAFLPGASLRLPLETWRLTPGDCVLPPEALPAG